MFPSVRYFNLLFLDESEEYLTDIACSFSEHGSRTTEEGARRHGAVPSRGRLRVCSRSLIFEPDNLNGDILKLPFARIASIVLRDGQDQGKRLKSICLSITETVKISTIVYNGKTRCVTPFVTQRTPPDATPNLFVITLLCRHGLDGSLNTVPYLYRLAVKLWCCASAKHAATAYAALLRTDDVSKNSTLPGLKSDIGNHSYSASLPVQTLKKVVSEELELLGKSLVQFDLSRLDHRESLLLPPPHSMHGLWVYRLKPLVRHRGVLQLTDSSLYFQPHPNFSNKPYKRIFLEAILHVLRRVSGLKPTALELISFASPSVDGKGKKYGQGGTVRKFPGACIRCRCMLIEFETWEQREIVAGLIETHLEERKINNICSSKAKSGYVRIQHSRKFLKFMTSLWQNGELSNFHYLDFLNCLGGRSPNDFTQYPIFPWVLSAYSGDNLPDLGDPSNFRDLTKPVGALNMKRLEALMVRMLQLQESTSAAHREARTALEKARQSTGEDSTTSPAYDNSDDEAFTMNDVENMYLYGSHYSTPAFVVYWLLRLIPECQLRLHGGRFDGIARMFNSVESAYNSVLTGHATYMELLPEFYRMPPDVLKDVLSRRSEKRRGTPTVERHVLNIENRSINVFAENGNFLVNALSIKTNNGLPLDDVSLPSWSYRGCSDLEQPRVENTYANQRPSTAVASVQFLRYMRAALESPYASRYLPQWIDLIFGYKQTGMQALRSFNLFHPLTYVNGSIAVTSNSCSIGFSSPQRTKILETMRKDLDPDAIEIQVQEFGQTPIQLFDKPHCRRNVCPIWNDTDVLDIINPASSPRQETEENDSFDTISDPAYRDVPWYVYVLMRPEIFSKFLESDLEKDEILYSNVRSSSNRIPSRIATGMDPSSMDQGPLSDLRFEGCNDSVPGQAERAKQRRHSRNGTNARFSEKREDEINGGLDISNSARLYEILEHESNGSSDDLFSPRSDKDIIGGEVHKVESRNGLSSYDIVRHGSDGGRLDFSAWAAPNFWWTDLYLYSLCLGLAEERLRERVYKKDRGERLEYLLSYKVVCDLFLFSPSEGAESFGPPGTERKEECLDFIANSELAADLELLEVPGIDFKENGRKNGVVALCELASPLTYWIKVNPNRSGDCWETDDVHHQSSKCRAIMCDHGKVWIGGSGGALTRLDVTSYLALAAAREETNSLGFDCPNDDTNARGISMKIDGLERNNATHLEGGAGTRNRHELGFTKAERTVIGAPDITAMCHLGKRITVPVKIEDLEETLAINLPDDKLEMFSLRDLMGPEAEGSEVAAVGLDDGMLLIQKYIEGGEPIVKLPHISKKIYADDMNYDSSSESSCSEDKSMLDAMFRWNRLCEVPQAHRDTISCLDFNESSKSLLTGSSDMTAKLWKISSCEVIEDQVFDYEIESEVTAINLQDNLAAVCTVEGEVLLFDSRDNHYAPVWYSSVSGSRAAGRALVRSGSPSRIKDNSSSNCIITCKLNSVTHNLTVVTGGYIKENGDYDSSDRKTPVCVFDIRTTKKWTPPCMSPHAAALSGGISGSILAALCDGSRYAFVGGAAPLENFVSSHKLNTRIHQSDTVKHEEGTIAFVSLYDSHTASVVNHWTMPELSEASQICLSSNTASLTDTIVVADSKGRLGWLFKGHLAS